MNEEIVLTETSEVVESTGPSEVSSPTSGGFVQGTSIDTPNGSRPVESLQPGDEIWGWEADNRVPTQVRSVELKPRQRVVAYRFVHSPRHDFLVTPAQRVYIQAQGDYVALESIHPGAVCFAWEFGRMVESPLIEVEPTEKRATVYTVVANTPFFANGVLVRS